ncbi:hypothetical protein MC885_017016 [Smutsia gigantea]|nr:hypothetical protein MC885_017016 [Smutsia gigantea]
MSPRCWNPTMVAHSVLWILFGLLLWPEPGTATLPLLMDSVIQALAELEQKAPVTNASHTASAWLLSAQDSGPHDPFHHFLLERRHLKVTELNPPPLTPELRGLTEMVVRHRVQGGQEYGVVLAPDGSTVAVEPLLVGLEAGLQGHRVVNLPLDSSATPPGIGAMVPEVKVPPPELSDAFPEVTSAKVEAMSPDVRTTDLDAGATFPDVRPGSADVQTSLPDSKDTSPTTVESLLGVSLARDLGLTFLQGPQTRSHPGLGTEGCWDQLSAPQTFTLLDPEAPPLTTAFLNGALDGALLGDYLSRAPEPLPPLSHLLRQYYGAGVAADPRLRSNFRRQNGALLTSAPTLTRQVWGALVLLQTLEPAHPQLQGMSQEQLVKPEGMGITGYSNRMLLDLMKLDPNGGQCGGRLNWCPAIHPRCRWGAAPYRGRPTPLQLPLGFLYVHHTYVPAPPCTDFAHCAADMRSMQRFHQETRGWEDIGYSFVVGSDGYVYEGRGWHWVGAHTRGHNSRGFGVALVGNYTAELPTEAALRTLHDMLPRCAVRAGLLRPDYALLGHRQLVHTDCPGDALFSLLRSWPRFAAVSPVILITSNVKPRTARRASRRSERKPPPMIPPVTDLQ